jgi:hypothetical protein
VSLDCNRSNLSCGTSRFSPIGRRTRARIAWASRLAESKRLFAGLKMPHRFLVVALLHRLTLRPFGHHGADIPALRFGFADFIGQILGQRGERFSRSGIVSIHLRNQFAMLGWMAETSVAGREVQMKRSIYLQRVSETVFH